MENRYLKVETYLEEFDKFEHGEVFANVDKPYEAFKRFRDYVTTRASMADGDYSKVKMEKTVYITGDVVIGEGTEISHNVVIQGPVIIGKNCKIQTGALIRPYTVLGNEVIIGHSAEVKESVVLDKAKLQTFTFTGNSIIGEGARIGSGTIVSNRRFDQKNIGIKIDGKYYDFGVDFCGCILGDYARLGANCTVYPGALIGAYSWVMPMTPVKGVIEHQKIVEYKEGKYSYRDKERTKLK